MMQGSPVNPQRPAGMPMNQGAAPMPPQGAAPQQSGLRAVENIGFNQDVQNIVLSRIQRLTPEEGAMLDEIIDEETLPVLLKILPELEPLFNMMMQSGQGQGPITSPAPAASAQVSDNPLVRDGMASRGLVG